MAKKTDNDIKALKACKKALLQSTSSRMLRANLNYLLDLFITNPPAEIKKIFSEKDEKK